MNLTRIQAALCVWSVFILGEKMKVSEAVIKTIAKWYGLECSELSRVIDTSRGVNDVRLNCIICDKYVIKINSVNCIDEERLSEIARLVERYRKCGVYCPALIRNEDGKYSHAIDIDGEKFICYTEEFALFKVCGDTPMSRKKIVEHLGIIASRYTNIDLSDTNSMWSLIDLAPLDTDVDEKQENLDSLVECLKKINIGDLAEKVSCCNEKLREIISSRYKELPRCCYQADLNPENILVDDNGEFAGVIDFNLSGTEVNINCFLNETNWFPQKEEFDSMSVEEMLTCMTERQNELLEAIFRHYELNPIECEMFPYYKRIIDLEQYPNVCFLISVLKDEERRNKAVDLIEAMISE